MKKQFFFSMRGEEGEESELRMLERIIQGRSSYALDALNELKDEKQDKVNKTVAFNPINESIRIE